MKIKRIRQILIPILFIAFAASITWTFISVKAKQQPSPGREISLSVIPDYKIISRKPLMLWPTGTVFEQGLAAYFYAADPVVTLTPVIQTTGLETGSLQGTIQSKVLLQAVNDKSQVYWSYPLKQTPLQSFTLIPCGSGREGIFKFTAADILLDVTAAYETMTYISNELMFQNGIFQMVVASDINISGTANGAAIAKSINQTLPLTLQTDNFTIPKTQDIQSQYTFNSSNKNASLLVSVIDTIRLDLLPFGIDALLLLLLFLLISTNNIRKSKELREHRRFREWITEGSVDVKDRLSINILSLEGLVDLAIDLDKRVIFDPTVHKYYVLTEDLVYIYDSERSRALLENKEMLGKLLLKRGLITAEQLEMGLYYQKKNGIKLGKSLIALGFIDETLLYSTLAAQQQIDYYELNPTKDFINIPLLESVGLQKAQALMAIPLGERADGRLVVACSDAAGKGLQDSLQELFGRQITIVATKPSAIYEVLELVDTRHREKENPAASEALKASYERITDKEREVFMTSYERGNIPHALLLKASGLVDQAILNQAPEHGEALSWLVNKNYIDGEYANLIKGLNIAVEGMEWKARKEKQIPDLAELLLRSNYLTIETTAWLHRELSIQGLSASQLLLKNYLASEETIHKASTLLHTLESLLYKSGNAPDNNNS